MRARSIAILTMAMFSGASCEKPNVKEKSQAAERFAVTSNIKLDELRRAIVELPLPRLHEKAAPPEFPNRSSEWMLAHHSDGSLMLQIDAWGVTVDRHERNTLNMAYAHPLKDISGNAVTLFAQVSWNGKAYNVVRCELLPLAIR